MKKISTSSLRGGSREIILGVDPGLSVTGWGVVEYRPNNFTHVNHGSIPTQAGRPLKDRLKQIYEEIKRVLHEHKPDSVSIENFFVGVNPRTTIQTVHVRGVLLLAFSEYSIGEYAPNSVKKCLVGEGHATKDQVQNMVRHFLKIQNDSSFKLNSHESDALALSICHAHNRLSRLFEEP